MPPTGPGGRGVGAELVDGDPHLGEPVEMTAQVVSGGAQSPDIDAQHSHADHDDHHREDPQRTHRWQR